MYFPYRFKFIRQITARINLLYYILPLFSIAFVETVSQAELRNVCFALQNLHKIINRRSRFGFIIIKSVCQGNSGKYKNYSHPLESFWKTLECEMADISHLTFKEAKRKIVEYIELYYNSDRLHSGINYSIPNQFFTLLSV